MSSSENLANAIEEPTDSADLLSCLPEWLRTPSTVIARIAAGMSGAGVYRVEVADQQLVLKITPSDEPIDAWRNRLRVQQSAATAGIAPELLHVDEDRRAVLSALIVDRSLPAHLGNPATRESTIGALGELLRKRRELPVLEAMERADPMRVLIELLSTLPETFTLPTFVREEVEELRSTASPAGARQPIMSHNDVNPTNLVFDGTRAMLLDWQTAAPNDPMYDIATIAMFLLLDDATCRRLIAEHDGVRVDALPEEFLYYRRVAATLSGIATLRSAHLLGHAGGEVYVNATPSLREVYQQMRSGSFDVGTIGGRWTFGLALVKEAGMVRSASVGGMWSAQT